LGEFFVNPARRVLPPGRAEPDTAAAFHRKLPGYRRTPVVPLPELARRLGVGELAAKDESNRLGLPAFKVLGASWATYRALVERTGDALDGWSRFSELRERLAVLPPLTLVAATAGNHGRAVAWIARQLGLAARITVPAGTAQARIAALEAEGAEVRVHPDGYDAAVAELEGSSSADELLVQDNALDSESPMVGWILEGYGSLVTELGETGERPDVVVLPIGAGALAAGVIEGFRRHYPASQPRFLGVEPVRAACALASLRAGEVVTIPGPHDSIMTGLNCGRLAAPAWPVLRDGLDALVTIDDAACERELETLADVAGLRVGECSAAGLAALSAVVREPRGAQVREVLGLGAESRALFLVTEGVTGTESGTFSSPVPTRIAGPPFGVRR